MKKLFIAVCLLLTLQATAQEKIRVISITRDIQLTPIISGKIFLTAEFRLPIPITLDTASSDVQALAMSYKNTFPIDRVVNLNGVKTVIFKQTFPINITQGNAIIDATYIHNFLEIEYENIQTQLAAFQAMPFDSVIGQSLRDQTWEATAQ